MALGCTIDPTTEGGQATIGRFIEAEVPELLEACPDLAEVA